MQNKYKRLLLNSLLFSISNFSSKLLSILIVPLYTYYLNPEQFGMIDLGTMLTQLIFPIVSLSIYESLLRFNITSKNNEVYLNNSLFILIIGSVISLCLYPIFLIVFNEIESLLLVLIVVLQMFFQTLSQYAKSIDKNGIFALSGFINTVLNLSFNIILLVIWNFGVVGYFVSIVLSLVIVNLFLIISLNIFKKFNYNLIHKKILKEMIIYSLPLIPNSVMWWGMSSLNRPLITFYLSASMTGLYAVANKVPTFLNMFTTIFSQAWQISAIEESESADQSSTYSRVFEVFSTLLYLVSLLIILIIKYLFKNFINDSYELAWTIVPPLLIANIFAGFSSFFGISYTVNKKTNGVFLSSLLGAVINLVLNIFLLRIFGINGAAFSSILSYLVMTVIRYRDTVKFTNIKLNYWIHFFNIFLLSSISFHIVNTKYVSLLVIFISPLLFVLINFNILKELILIVGKKLRYENNS